jgi:hypothetical protein
MDAEAVVREFKSEAEAALAAAVLEANGIHAEVVSAGFGFHTMMAGRSTVIARTGDIARARELLDTSADS